jgi:hypothetical protein
MVDTQTVDMAAILEKIALMKDLQERAGTPGEAAAAAAGIQRLMFRYNISEIEVQRATRDESEGFDREDYNIGGREMWKATLLNTIASFNFCRMVYFTGRKGGNIGALIGKKNNIIVTTNLYEFLVDELVRLAEIAWREAVEEVQEQRIPFMRQPSMNAKSFKNAFYLGAVQEIRNRLREQREESVADQEGSSALVLVEEKALDDAVYKMFGRLRSGGRSTINDSNGYRRGKSAGRSVNLVNQIGG